MRASSPPEAIAANGPGGKRGLVCTSNSTCSNPAADSFGANRTRSAAPVIPSSANTAFTSAQNGPAAARRSSDSAAAEVWKRSLAAAAAASNALTCSACSALFANSAASSVNFRSKSAMPTPCLRAMSCRTVN